MIDRETYLKIKKDIQCLCRSNVIELCNDMQLTDYEKDLLIGFYDGKSRLTIMMELNISITKYTNDMKTLFSKINDYKNTH